MTNRAGYKHHDTQDSKDISQVAQNRIGFKHYDAEPTTSNQDLDAKILEAIAEQEQAGFPVQTMSPAQKILQYKINGICSLMASDVFSNFIAEQKQTYIQELMFLVSANTEMDLKQMVTK